MYYMQEGYIHKDNTVVFRKTDIKNAKDEEFKSVNIALDIEKMKKIIEQVENNEIEY